MRSNVYCLLLAVVCCSLLPAICWADAPLLDLHFVNEDVGIVLRTLAMLGGVDMVIDDSVKGRISMNVHGVPLDTAIEIVAKTKGLTYQRIGQVFVVGTSERLGRSFGRITVFTIRYANAPDVAELLRVVFKEGAKQTADMSNRLQVDKVSNVLVFNGSPEEVAQINEILAQVDIPYQQVSLEAQVVAINKRASKDLGIEWEWSKTPTYPQYEPPQYSTVLDNNGNAVTTQTSPGKFSRDKADMTGTIQFGRSPGGYPYEFYYQAKINALVINGKANVLAKPKIITLNGKEAIINIGDRVPIPITTTSNNVTTSSVTYENVGIILKYTPRVNADGQITAKVHTEVSSPSYVTEMKAYKFTTRSADTEVRLRDGETMVIGGLIGKEEFNSMRKVPFLADLPIVGRLFENISKSKDETEVVIFLTARIVK
jgi:type IV pilus secretin PilQ/predicted competence protein